MIKYAEVVVYRCSKCLEVIDIARHDKLPKDDKCEHDWKEVEKDESSNS